MENLKILAVKALEAENFKEANDYVLRLLELDIADAEIWALKAKINLASTTYLKINSKQVVASLRECKEIDHKDERILSELQIYIYEKLSIFNEQCANQLLNTDYVNDFNLSGLFGFSYEAAKIIDFSSTFKHKNVKLLKLGVEIINDALKPYKVNDPLAFFNSTIVGIPEDYETELKKIKDNLINHINDIEPDYQDEGNNKIVNFKESSCFVVTVVTGSADNYVVSELREFRDNILHSNKIGILLSKLYYTHGAKIADFISDKEYTKEIIRLLIINPLYIFSKIINRLFPYK